MPRKVAMSSTLLASLLFACMLFAATETPISSRPSERHFTFDYTFTVRNTNPGKPMRIWIPLAESNPSQEVRILSKSGDLPLKQTREREYGNAMLYASTENADKPEYHFTIKYDVIRWEHLVLSAAYPSRPEKASAQGLERFLEPDKLVPITGVPAELARKQVASGDSDLTKARKLYDYTFATLRYDKTGTGWGRGDTLWVCDSKHGNCTDFHSLFISMARSQKIPARYEMGFSIPIGKTSGEVTGYHCWAEFYTRDRGWVPVDISEAWKNPKQKDYFFGAHDQHRLQFSIGRDITLDPPQAGEALNYFVFPYVESDGKSYSNVSMANSFADAGNSQVALKQ
jgi:transglutaminase-like putative cysteine protease